MAFNYLRLRHIGRTPATAAFVVGLPLEFVLSLEASLATCAPKLEKAHRDDPIMKSAAELIGRVRIERYAMLMASKKTVELNSSTELEHFEQFVSTVGKSRQIVLFEAAHLATMSAFLTDLGLGNRDVVLIHPKGALVQGYPRSGGRMGVARSSKPVVRHAAQVQCRAPAPHLEDAVQGDELVRV